MINGKTVEIGGKKFIINKAPATVAYEVALKYQKILRTGKDEVSEQVDCLNKLMKFVSVDLGDGRKMPLDSESAINQHITNVKDLVELQKEVTDVNFGFFLGESPSDS